MRRNWKSLLLLLTRFSLRFTNSFVSYRLPLLPFPPSQVNTLINQSLSSDLATFDISQAVKQMPEVAAGLAAAVFTLLGMLLALFGFIGSAPTKVKQTSVKTKSVAPVAPAGEEEKKALEQAGVEVPAAEGSKKRVTRSTKE